MIKDLKDKFGRLHSENKVKNCWNAKQRSLSGKARAKKQKQKINSFVHSFPSTFTQQKQENHFLSNNQFNVSSQENNLVHYLPLSDKSPFPFNNWNCSSTVSNEKPRVEQEQKKSISVHSDIPSSLSNNRNGSSTQMAIPSLLINEQENNFIYSSLPSKESSLNNQNGFYTQTSSPFPANNLPVHFDEPTSLSNNQNGSSKRITVSSLLIIEQENNSAYLSLPSKESSFNNQNCFYTQISSSFSTNNQNCSFTISNEKARAEQKQKENISVYSDEFSSFPNNHNGSSTRITVSLFIRPNK